jgi:hypothetical protein
MLYSSSSSHQEGKQKKGTPATHAPTIAITPALATVGGLIIERHKHTPEQTNINKGCT